MDRNMREKREEGKREDDNTTKYSRKQQGLYRRGRRSIREEVVQYSQPHGSTRVDVDVNVDVRGRGIG
jgi:hypothetical protein